MFMSAKFTMLAFLVLLLLFVRSTFLGFIFLLLGDLSVCSVQILLQTILPLFVHLIEGTSFKNPTLPSPSPQRAFSHCDKFLESVLDTGRLCSGFSVCVVCTVAVGPW